MASAGLLGFIQGVSKGVVEEYDRQKEIGDDIDTENRAEARAIKAEQRREAAERRAADYRKQLDLEYAPRQAEAEAAAQVGLIDRDMDPTIARQRRQEQDEVESINEGRDPASLRAAQQAKDEAARIRRGEDPTVLREEQSAIEEAERVRGGALTDPEIARSEAGYKARERGDEEAEVLAARLADDKARDAAGLPTSGKKEVDISFKPSEAATQLKNDLSSQHGYDLSLIKKRMTPEGGGSRLEGMRIGNEEIGEILSDEEGKKQLKEELIIKLHSQAERELKQAAKSKHITDLGDVSELSNVIVTQADEVMTNIEQAHVAMQEAKTPEDKATVMGILEENMAAAWGEQDKKPDKRSPAFQSMWNTFRKALSS